MAVLAGAGLAIANARSDLDADVRAGTRSVATALGAERSWWIGAGVMAASTVVGVVLLAPIGRSPASVALVAAGTSLVAIGLVVGRGWSTSARRRGWEAQAIGAAIAATGWVAGLLPGP
jgi:4-hydroxybenzoate polyprenyltransferase